MAQKHSTEYIEKPMTTYGRTQGPSRRYRRLRHPTFPSAEWADKNPLLQRGEIGAESDTHKIKVGDGLTYWNDLPYASEDVARWGDIVGTLSDQTDLNNALTGKVSTDGSSTMTGVLKMRATSSFQCAIAPFWDGVGFYKLNNDDSVTLIASIETPDGFLPWVTNTYNIGSSLKKWKNLYLAGKLFATTLNNGGDLAVPTVAGTIATTADVELAANSGSQLYSTGVWYAKMYAATTPPTAADGTNYADFSQVDSDNNPIIVIYERQSGAWVQVDTITPPAEYNGYLWITSKIWDITEQTDQQGGEVLWDHAHKTFTPYPRIVKDALPDQTGHSGEFLTTNGTATSWAGVDALPVQTGHSGEFLTTDGTDASWAAVDALPSQTGQSGKFLTTDGTDASWATVDALPDQTGQSGKFLTTDGTNASWGAAMPIPGGYTSAGSGMYVGSNTNAIVGQLSSAGAGNNMHGYTLSRKNTGDDGLCVDIFGTTGYSVNSYYLSSTAIYSRYGTMTLGKSNKPWANVYTTKLNNGADIAVPKIGGTMAIQVSSMPTADSASLGVVVQYTGTTDANYTHGYIYECVSDGGNPATYSWTAVQVQAGGGADVDLSNVSQTGKSTAIGWGLPDYSTAQTANLALGSFTAPYDCLVIYQSGLKNSAQEILYIGTTRVLLAENGDNNWKRSTTVFPMSAGEILTGLAANDGNRDSQLQYFKFKGQP